MEHKTKILFRADGNQKIGLGHVYRCLAIAEYLEDDFEIEFITTKNCENIKKIIPWDYDLRILLDYDTVEEEGEYLAKQYKQQKVIYVVDGYQFTSEYLKFFIENKVPVVYIDDKHEITIYADLVINHASGFTKDEFDTNLLCNFCIGPKYAILRKSFIESPREEYYEYEVLVCFGGADPDNHTQKVLNNLPKNIKVAVLVGRAYQHMLELKTEILGIEGAHFFSGLSSSELADLMEKSERAIMSSSSVAYEYLTASAGQLYIIQTADNQSLLFKYLISEKAALEYDGVFDAEFVSNRINDGMSPQRILREFKSLEYEKNTEVRDAQLKDLGLIFEWANDPIVREQSFYSEEISLDTHSDWFKNKLKDSNSKYYLFENEENIIGQVRYDLYGKEAVIGFLVAPTFRKKGWGYRILKLGIRRLINDCPEIKLVKGYVKINNQASIKSFIRCNFNKNGTDEYPSSVVFTLNL